MRSNTPRHPAPATFASADDDNKSGLSAINESQAGGFSTTPNPNNTNPQQSPLTFLPTPTQPSPSSGQLRHQTLLDSELAENLRIQKETQELAAQVAALKQQAELKKLQKKREKGERKRKKQQAELERLKEEEAKRKLEELHREEEKLKRYLEGGDEDSSEDEDDDSSDGDDTSVESEKRGGSRKSKKNSGLPTARAYARSSSMGGGLASGIGLGLRQIKSKGANFFGSGEGNKKKSPLEADKYRKSRSSDSEDSDESDVENRGGLGSSSSQLYKRKSSKDKKMKGSSSASKRLHKRKKGRNKGGQFQFAGKSENWKELAHKIAMAILTDLDDETLQREDTEMILVIITLIKEAMLGVLIAFVAVSLVLFLDHRLLLNIPTARNFRRATFQLMNDRETLRNLEENANLKLMEQEDFSTMMHEIGNAANKTKLAYSIYQTRSEDMVKMSKDLVDYSQQMPILLAELDLDKFCGHCIWSKSQHISCNQRAEALQKTYQIAKYEAMVSAMKKRSCKGTTGQNGGGEDDGSFQQRKKEDEILDNWGTEKKDFCADVSSVFCVHYLLGDFSMLYDPVYIVYTMH